MVRQFDIITEADARRIEPGTSVELRAGGHVTPLAADTLKARRITVVPAGSIDPALPADLAPMGFLVLCLAVVWWIFRTGWKLKA